MIPIDTACKLGKAQGQGQKQGQEDTELAGRAEQEGRGIGKHRTEIGHGADPDEDEQREELRRDPGVVDDPDEPFVAHDIRQGDVDQDTAETDGDQEQRFAVLLDPQIQKDETHE